MSQWTVPGECTKIPASSVTLTNRIFPIDKNVVPAVLSLRDIRWETENCVPCAMRKSLQKAGYMVEPALPERDKLVL